MAAAIIWIFVKLPQEYWLHVAELDVTDTLEDYWWAWPVLIAAARWCSAAFLWFVARPRLPEPTTLAARVGPGAAAVDTAAKLAALHEPAAGCSRG